MTEKKTTRVQMELPNQSMDRLKLLKDKTEAISYTEVVKKSLNAYEMLLEIKKSRRTVLLKDESGSTQEIFFL